MGEPLYPDTVTALMTKLINRHNKSVTPRHPAQPARSSSWVSDGAWFQPAHWLEHVVRPKLKPRTRATG
jgi:hypothetical protein